MACLILSFGLPFIGFLIPFLDLPGGVTALLMGILTLGGPEVMILLAVLLLGKEVLDYFKQKVFRLFKRRSHEPIQY